MALSFVVVGIPWEEIIQGRFRLGTKDWEYGMAWKDLVGDEA
jgi:hypothetical protein